MYFLSGISENMYCEKKVWKGVEFWWSKFNSFNIKHKHLLQFNFINRTESCCLFDAYALTLIFMTPVLIAVVTETKPDTECRWLYWSRLCWPSTSLWSLYKVTCTCFVTNMVNFWRLRWSSICWKYFPAYNNEKVYKLFTTIDFARSLHVSFCNLRELS